MTWISRFNKWTIKFLQAVTNFIVLLLTALFKGFGALVITGVFLVVEVHRITQGVQLFENVQSYAVLAAIGLVFLNFLIDQIIVDLELAQGEINHKRYRFSMRLIWREIRYFIGADELEEVPDISLYVFLRRINTLAILGLGLFGSLRFILPTIEGVWYVGFWNILTKSNTEQMATYFTATLTTFVLVYSAQGLSRHFAILSHKIMQNDEKVIRQSNIQSLMQNEDVSDKKSDKVSSAFSENKRLRTKAQGKLIEARKETDDQYVLLVKNESGQTTKQVFHNEIDITVAMRGLKDLRSWKIAA